MRVMARATKPSEQVIRRELGKLRAFIDLNVMTNPLEARVAYIWETAIRWATEETTWPKPIEHIEADTELVRHDAEVSAKSAGREEGQ